MNLSIAVGRDVIVDLNEQAKDVRTISLFYNTHDENTLIINKLTGVDDKGIWLEGFKTVTILAEKDKDGNVTKLEHPKELDAKYSVFIRWEYINGVAVMVDPTIDSEFIKID